MTADRAGDRSSDRAGERDEGKAVARRKGGGVAAQYVLFEQAGFLAPPAKATNLVGLYDCAPKYVFSSPETKAKASGDSTPRLPLVRREFYFDGQPFVSVVTPARMTKTRRLPDGTTKIEEYECYPGEREQIVEEVIRSLASRRGRLHTAENQRPAMTFTLYEVMKELAAVKHTLSIDEVKTALYILRRTSLRIESPVDNEDGVESNIFTALGMRKRRRGASVPAGAAASPAGTDADTYVQFSPWVEQAIRRVESQSIRYDWLMALSPIARWLYKRITFAAQRHGEATPSTITMTANEIIRDSGATPWSRTANMYRWIRTTVIGGLIEVGALSEVEEEVLKDGLRYVDVTYRMRLSDTFLAHIAEARRKAQADAELMDRMLADKPVPDRLLPVSDDGAAAIRRRRQQMHAAAAGPAVPEPVEALPLFK